MLFFQPPAVMGQRAKILMASCERIVYQINEINDLSTYIITII